MTRNGWNSSSQVIRSQLTRRRLVQGAAVGVGALAMGNLGLPCAARAADVVNFWATGTLDIGGDGWKTFSDESEVNVNFTDNGNDPGPPVAKLAVRNANPISERPGPSSGREYVLAPPGVLPPQPLFP